MNPAQFVSVEFVNLCVLAIGITLWRWKLQNHTLRLLAKIPAAIIIFFGGGGFLQVLFRAFQP